MNDDSWLVCKSCRLTFQVRDCAVDINTKKPICILCKGPVVPLELNNTEVKFQ